MTGRYTHTWATRLRPHSQKLACTGLTHPEHTPPPCSNAHVHRHTGTSTPSTPNHLPATTPPRTSSPRTVTQLPQTVKLEGCSQPPIPTLPLPGLGDRGRVLRSHSTCLGTANAAALPSQEASGLSTELPTHVLEALGVWVATVSYHLRGHRPRVQTQKRPIQPANPGCCPALALVTVLTLRACWTVPPRVPGPPPEHTVGTVGCSSLLLLGPSPHHGRAAQDLSARGTPRGFSAVTGECPGPSPGQLATTTEPTLSLVLFPCLVPCQGQEVPRVGQLPHPKARALRRAQGG